MTIARVLDGLADRIERAEGLDGTAAALGSVAATLVRPGRLKDAAAGSWLGHPLHPLLVAIPIGAWSTSLVLDARGQHEAAKTLIGVGLVAAAPTGLSGLADWSDTAGAEKRVGLVHAGANYATIALFGLSYAARRRGSTTTGRVLGIAGAAAMSAAGWLGGHLAYAQGVGVDTTAFQQLPQDWTDAAASAEVHDRPLAVTVDGAPVLLVREGTAVRALADRCTHRGAPLHEGDLHDGCVTCPWHGSRFRLSDGAVVAGPATRPQPVLEVREVAGRIEVRRPDEPRTLRTNPTGR